MEETQSMAVVQIIGREEFCQLWQGRLQGRFSFYPSSLVLAPLSPGVLRLVECSADLSLSDGWRERPAVGSLNMVIVGEMVDDPAVRDVLLAAACWQPASSTPEQVIFSLQRLGRASASQSFRQVQEMALLLNSQHNFDDLFQAIIRSVSKIMAVDRTSLFLLDEARQELWTQVAEGVDKPIRIAMGQGLAGRCAEECLPILVEDVHSHPDFDGSWDAKLGYQTRNILSYPVLNRKQELKGVLQMINKLGGPFQDQDLSLAAVCAAQIGVALENRQLFDELREGFESFIRTLTATIDAKHPLTAGHSSRVTEYALFLGRHLGLDEVSREILKYAALLHDVGKISVPDRILTKNGFFTEEELKVMQGHPRWSGHILEQMLLPRHLKSLPQIAASHHERIDGTGYPQGLDVSQIPLLARVIAVADVFDALTSRRDYPKYDADGETNLGHNPLAIEKAFSVMEHGAGTQLDARIVELAVRERAGLTELCARLHHPAAAAADV
ncbi:MAG: HD domain-containing protein [Desulfuromonadaceae bacterium]|nr:HD domain-containing protein [Desulfuromonadaceae bacterium]